MNSKVFSVSSPLESQQFKIMDLVIESDVLRNNPLKDSNVRHNFVLLPKIQTPCSVVVHLSGYFSNGPQSFNLKTLEENFPQQLISQTEKGQLAPAIHCFVDAMTAVGGSQFINSKGCGLYSDYIQTEVVTALKKHFLCSEKWIVMGSSSGGYGALHHISLKSTPFQAAIAVSPDSDFSTSLLHEYYKLAPFLINYSNTKQVFESLKSGTLQKNKNFFSLMNAIAMALCYGPSMKGKMSYPIDLKTGQINQRVWSSYLQKDPIFFLKKNIKNLKNKKVLVSVGEFDEFNLYFGARLIKNVLKQRTHLSYSEFPGGHFSLNTEKLKALTKLF